MHSNFEGRGQIMKYESAVSVSHFQVRIAGAVCVGAYPLQPVEMPKIPRDDAALRFANRELLTLLLAKFGRWQCWRWQVPF